MKYTRDSKKILRILSRYFEISENKILENKYKNDLKKYYIFLLKKYSRFKNSEIGDLYGIKPSTVTDTVRRFKEQMKKNKDISKNIKNIESELRRPDPASPAS